MYSPDDMFTDCFKSSYDPTEDYTKPLSSSPYGVLLNKMMRIRL